MEARRGNPKIYSQKAIKLTNQYGDGNNFQKLDEFFK
jgi:hypothetical protein